MSVSVAYGAGAASLGELKQLLTSLPALYPRAQTWLTQRYRDIEEESAHLITAHQGEDLIGVCIGVSKTEDRFKICTIFVAPHARREGVGVTLLAEMLDHISGQRPLTVYATGPHHRRRELSAVFRSVGLERTATLRNRYGSGRHEDIYTLVLD